MTTLAARSCGRGHSRLQRRPGTLLALNGLAVCALLSIGAQAAVPFNFDTAGGRLPKSIVPLDYTITVRPDVKARTFTGTESVRLKFRKASDTVVFNTLGLRLANVRLDGVPVKQVVTDDKAQLTTLTLAAAAKTGQHTLTLSYSGAIGSSPRGLFVQPYRNSDGSGGVLLTTQMEPSDARRMFPSWDEPAFRARYQLTAVLPAAWAAVGNMPVAKRVVQGTLATTTFQRSPPMPSYLVELTAGDIREVSGESDGVRLGVWAVRGHEAEGTTALANAKQILADYDAYFGYKFPLPKLDSIAIPGGFSGAMENWGAITYTADALLLDSTSGAAARQEVYSTQAHEMAHQWTGDLVTMAWWDDLWLNESFASWRSAKETDLRNPGWKWWESQDADKEVAMSADAASTSAPIEHHVANELEAGTAFDPAITYRKGQAILRMLEAYLGPDTFRDGIRAYVKARAFSNATSADLWNALSAQSHQDVGAIASGWTEQPGFPIVSVAATCEPSGQRTLTLSQQRFLLPTGGGAVPDAHRLHWQIPLFVRVGAAGRPHPVLLTRDGQTLSAGTCAEPVTINADAIGFFRVRYDAATLGVITRSFGSLPDADRIALLDDQWALVDTGRAPLASYLALAAGMGRDLDARAWEQIAGALGQIVHAESGTPAHDLFAARARALLKPLAGELGWDPKAGETAALQELRRTVIAELGLWGDPEVRAEALRRLGTLERAPQSLAPDDQAVILEIAAAYADEATFARLHALARRAKTEAGLERRYATMALVRDPKLAEQVVQIATGTELPPQALQVKLSMIAELQEYHPKVAWTAFSAHAQELLAPAGALEPLFLTQLIPGYFWNSLPPGQLEAWLRAHVPAQLSANIAKGMETVRFKILEKKTLMKAADTYLAAHAHD